jgi:membrane-bound serine protease (ClpP class)
VITIVALVLAFFVLPAPWNVLVVVAAAVVDTVETAAFVAWSRRRRRLQPPAVGAEALVGRRALVSKRVDPLGQVRVDGGIWAARSSEPVDAGVEVTISAVDGLILHVEAPDDP